MDTRAVATSPSPDVGPGSGPGLGDGLDIGIVGAGLGGLAAACTLAARGHRVTLHERNGWVGGKAATLDVDGYHFDMGPTILIMPSVLRRIFAEAGRELEDYLELLPLEPQWRCFYEDGSVLDLVADPGGMRENLDALAPGGAVADGYEKFLETSARLKRVSDDFFLWKSVGSVRDTLDIGDTFSPAVLADLVSMRFGRSVAQTVRSHIPDERVAQMVDHFTQYVGSSPAASPAVLCGIAQMQVGEGVWYPRGGTGAVPAALLKLAEELGVRVVTGAPVTRVLVEDGVCRGVITATGETRHDAVVSNADSVRTYTELVDAAPKAAKRHARGRHEPACSGVVLYLGLDKRYDVLEHHNFVFSEDPEVEFRQIYDEGVPADDPTAYLCAPAKTEPSVAPEGGEALYVLVHTPYLHPGQDWNAMFPGYRQVILDKLKRVAGLEDLETHIVTERHLTPQDINDRYSVLDGAIYGLASHGKWMGAFKPANRSPDVSALYLAGGSAHPGPGMPMALMSGWIAADSLDADAGKLGGGTVTSEPATAKPATTRRESEPMSTA